MEYSKLTIPMLKERLREAGLRVGGCKDELVKRWKELPEDRRIQIASSPRVRAADLSHGRRPASGASGALASTALRCVVLCERDNEIATLRRDLELAHAHAARERWQRKRNAEGLQRCFEAKSMLEDQLKQAEQKHRLLEQKLHETVREKDAEIASLRSLAYLSDGAQLSVRGLLLNWNTPTLDFFKPELHACAVRAVEAELVVVHCLRDKKTIRVPLSKLHGRIAWSYEN
tara:strand:- start:3544 stop:4236 length:693 start_codon:yes stop_codon:yes gene_type:complete